MLQKIAILRLCSLVSRAHRQNLISGLRHTPPKQLVMSASSRMQKLSDVSKPLVLVVAAALVQNKKVLLAQRPRGKNMEGMWEFPGGKVELGTGETPEQALVRELQEELGLELSEDDIEPLTFASHSYESFHLLMPLFLCRRWQGVPEAREGQALVWASSDSLKDFEMPEADVPLIPSIQATLM